LRPGRRRGQRADHIAGSGRKPCGRNSVSTSAVDRPQWFAPQGPLSICGRPLQRKGGFGEVAVAWSDAAICPACCAPPRRCWPVWEFADRVQITHGVLLERTVESPGFPDPVSPTVRHTLLRPTYASTPLRLMAVRPPAPELDRVRPWQAGPRRSVRSCWPRPRRPACGASWPASAPARSLVAHP